MELKKKTIFERIQNLYSYIMTELLADTLSNHFGRQLLHWVISQSDIRYLANRCADFVNKIHEPLERGASVLDNILTVDEEDSEFYGWMPLNEIQLRMHHGNQQILVDDDNNDDDDDNNDDDDDNYLDDIYYHHHANNEVETIHNGSFLLSPSNHNNNSNNNNNTNNNNNSLMQRENMQVTQPCSGPSSPLASPGALSATSFCIPSTSNSTNSSSSSNGNAGVAGGAATTGSANNSLIIDTGDPNWQATKFTIRERNAAMFNNELMADIHFEVGSEDNIQLIPAHKYVLATGSSVFYAMFFGGLAENNKEEIRVPDVEPIAFLTLLKYLYCDEIQLEADNVLATLYVAKKYIVPHLARACVNYLETSLTAKNACLLLSQSRLFEEPELMQRCWEVIDAQAEMAVKSEGFVDIDMKTFESILGRETLNCKEINLFEAALNWAQSACYKMEIDCTSQNRRHVLGGALQMIRIPTMTLEEFANGVAQIGILTPQETIDIFLNFTAKSKPTLQFITKPRAGLKTQVCHRFQSCAYRSNQWRYRGRCDSIQFSVDKRIFIVGFGLYGSSTGAADYSVKIELKRLGRILAENNTKFFSDGSSNTFHVFFENPIQVEPDSFYTASVILDGSELSFFGQEGLTEVCMGNVTFQFQCSSESTNGTGVQGGQIPELIFYGPTTMPIPSPTTTTATATATHLTNAIGVIGLSTSTSITTTTTTTTTSTGNSTNANNDNGLNLNITSHGNGHGSSSSITANGNINHTSTHSLTSSSTSSSSSGSGGSTSSTSVSPMSNNHNLDVE